MRSVSIVIGQLALAIAVLSSLFAGTVSLAAPPPEKIVVMVSEPDCIANMPARLAQTLGYFKDEGLDVDLKTQPLGASAEAELTSGAVQAVVGFYDHTIDLQSKGKSIEAIAVLDQTPGLAMLVSTRAASRFKNMADARGQILGVAGLGSTPEFLTRYLTERAGLSVTDYALLPMGGNHAFVTAMRQSRIQAGMTAEPAVSELLSSGDARVLVDLRTNQGLLQALGGPYPAVSVYARTAWADTHRAEAGKLAHAFARALQYIHTHGAEDIASKVPSSVYNMDKAHYLQALQAALPMFTADGKMPAGGPETVLKVLTAYKPQVNSGDIDLSKTYTNAFLAADGTWARSKAGQCKLGAKCCPFIATCCESIHSRKSFN